MSRGPNLSRFGLSCVCPVYFLRKSTELHEMQTERQIIIIHLLLIIYHKLPSIAKLFPILIFSSPVFALYTITP